MSGNVFDSPPTLRRSLRIAQITPSKILSGALNDDPSKLAHHEDYNRPTRLTDQGSRSRSPRAGSRRGTPKKKNGPTNRIDEIVHGEHPSSFYPIHLINYPPPLRMTTPQQTTYLSNESLINSRMKHAKTLDQHEPVNETPFKAFGEWPTDSLITPIVNAQNRRVNQTHVAPLEVLATQHPLRLTSELPTVKVARNKRVEASLERNVFKRKNSDSKNPTRAFFVEVNENLALIITKCKNFALSTKPSQYLSTLIIIISFFVSIFYGGQIVEFASIKYQFVSERIHTFVYPSQNSNIIEIFPKDYDTVKSRLSSVIDELISLKRQVEQLSSLDGLSLSRKINSLVSEGIDSKTSIQQIAFKLETIQAELLLLNDKQLIQSAEYDKLAGYLEGVEEGIENLQKIHQAQNSSFSKLENEFYAFQKQFNPPKLEEIEKIVLDKLDLVLPDRLLIKINNNGDISLDPRLCEYLTQMFGSATVKETNSYQFANANAIQNYVNGKLDAIEHKLWDKQQLTSFISKRITEELDAFSTNVQHDIETIKLHIANQLSTTGKPAQLQFDQDRFTESLILKTTAQVLQTLEAPKTQMKLPDFALESAGARPIFGFSSQSYHQNDGFLNFGRLLSIGSTRGKPHRVALSSDNSFGNCWAFNGHNGTLGISLAQPVIPTHFTIDHLSTEYYLDRSSAPKSIEIHAVAELSEPSNSIFLASYNYQLDGPNASQTFPAAYRLSSPCKHYLIRILSNHGNPDYTCLYHVGIHSDQFS